MAVARISVEHSKLFNETPHGNRTATLLLLFFAIAMAWPTWRIWQRDGINALVLPSDDTVHGLVGRWFKG